MSRSSKGTVDRFEGDQVVLEVEGKTQTRPRTSIGKGAREGDVIDLATGEVDVKASEEARQRTQKLQDELEAKSGPREGNDIEL